MARIESFGSLLRKSGHDLAPAPRLAPARLQRTKESAATPALIAFGGSEAQWRTNAGYEAFAKEGYCQNTTVYSAIDTIAKAASGIRIAAYRGHPGDKPQEITDGDLVQLLKRPNPQQSWKSFLHSWVAFQYIAGNGYVERIAGASGVPRELYVQRSDRMEVLPGSPLQRIKGYRYNTGVGKPIEWFPDVNRNGEPVQKILHTKFFHPLDDWYGLSPIAAAARAIDQSNEAQAWNVSLLQNGCRPSGFLNIKGTLSDDQKRDFRDELENRFQGVRNAGRPMVADGEAEVSWISMSNSPSEMDWLGGLHLNSRQICSVVGCPALLIGDVNDPTFANYKEAHRFLWTETVLPLMDFLLGEFNHWLVPFFGQGLYVGYDRNDIEALQDDQDSVWQRASVAWTSGLAKKNEARAMVGLPPDPDGDVYNVAVNTIQQGPAQKPNEPGQPPKEGGKSLYQYMSLARGQRRAA
jgi:HK97 family phage portal protein